MARRNLTRNLGELIDILKIYLTRRVDLIKLNVLEKISLVGSYFLTSVFLLVIAAFCLLFVSFAFVFWYANNFGSLSTGFLIVAVVYIIFGVIIFVFRRTLITKPIVRILSDIIFSDNPKEEVKKKLKLKEDE